MELLTIVAILGVVSGVFTRQWWPWLKKRAEMEAVGQHIDFAPKYAYAAVASLAMTVVSAMYAVAAFDMPIPADGIVAVQQLALFATMGFSYGYAFTAGIDIALDDPKVPEAPKA